MIKFNINEYVHVQLNKSGLDEIKKQHDKLKKSFPNLSCLKMPEEDDNGWSKWQMHDLMSTFGNVITMGMEPPFNTNIRIEVDNEIERANDN